ncbi:MAG: hypothetical protein SFV17_13635 [Candidatus Obscuribacter sp.]|nr:hypothetical protein [Candidatus Melainabacteria bacterium]MDX1987722.1 hypothetical protein [Candidatus Obscuribacter sp.]
MGGEIPADSGDGKQKKQEQPRISFSQAFDEVQQAPGVAPGALQNGEKPKSLDPFYTPPTDGSRRPGRATYGTDRDPTGGSIPRERQTEVPGNFQEHHADKARDPNQPYSRYDPTGRNQTAQVDIQQKARADAHIMSIIAKRGLANDISRDPDARTADGIMRGSTRLVVAGLGGVLASKSEGLINTAAERSVNFGEGLKASESGLKRTAGTVVEQPGKFWQRFGTSTGDYIPTKGANLAAEASTLRTGMIDSMQKIATEGSDDAAKALANHKLPILRGSITPDVIATAKTSPGIWSADEIANLEKISKAEATLAAQAKKAGGAVADDMGGFKAFRTGLTGAVGTYGAVLADRSLAETISGNKNAAAESWNVMQWAAPASLALGKTTWGKAGYLGVSLLGSRGTDALLGKAPDNWNAPTGMMDWKDAGMLGATLTLASRIPNPIGRVGVALAGVTAVKGIHAFEDNLPGNLKATYADTKEQVVNDSRERSGSSLNAMRESYQNLSAKKEDYLFDLVRASDEQMKASWNLKKQDGTPLLSDDMKLLAYRQDGVMRRSLADETIKNGTRIIDKSKVAYMLEGYNLDLNGLAADLLLRSASSTSGAAFMTQAIINNNNDSSKPKILVEGSQPTQAEIDGLNKFTADTRKNLDAILDGKHDIPGAINELSKPKWAGANSDDLLRTVVFEVDRQAIKYAKKGAGARDAAVAAEQAGNTAVAEMASREKQDCERMLAKLFRDQAVAYLAMAKNKLDHGKDGGGAQDLLFNEANNQHDLLPGNRRKAYNGAQGAILMAARFGGGFDNPDLKQLVEEYNKLAERVPATIRNNFRDTKLNPLNVDNGLQR